MNPIPAVRAYANAAEHFLLERYWDRRGRKVGRVSEAAFDEVLDRYDDDTVFVHAGLSDVKSAFDRNPYEFLTEKLAERFDSVLAPGFTPSFRSSGIYHKMYSRPEYGAFSKLFHRDADYRTDDAVHSILVRGDYRFDDCDHHRSFAEDGCWAKLDRENVLILNVGTPWIVSTQHHYVEHLHEVPYNSTVPHEGHIYYDETEHEPVTQVNYTYSVPARRSARKIEREMVEAGAIEAHDLEGLKVLAFRAGDLRRALADRVEDDPYYLIA